MSIRQKRPWLGTISQNRKNKREAFLPVSSDTVEWHVTIKTLTSGLGYWFIKAKFARKISRYPKMLNISPPRSAIKRSEVTDLYRRRNPLLIIKLCLPFPVGGSVRNSSSVIYVSATPPAQSVVTLNLCSCFPRLCIVHPILYPLYSCSASLLVLTEIQPRAWWHFAYPAVFLHQAFPRWPAWTLNSVVTSGDVQLCAVSPMGN